jgi:endonuclease III
MQIGAMHHPARPPLDEIEWIGNNGFDFVDLTLEPWNQSRAGVTWGVLRSVTAAESEAMTRIRLPQVMHRLQAYYGQPKVPKLAGPWEMILWENVAYLADDDQRQKAFRILRKQVGTEPEKILSAADEGLLEVTRHGILADQFAKKLRKCAKIVLEDFDGDLRPVVKLPFAKAKKSLQKFPGIGEPGAEKILLFTQSYPVLALESNGLRVLLRLGFGEQKKSYSTTYHLVQKAVDGELDQDFGSLIRAHLLLRRHGQELCKRSKPECGKCPLAKDCRYYMEVVEPDDPGP